MKDIKVTEAATDAVVMSPALDPGLPGLVVQDL